MIAIPNPVQSSALAHPSGIALEFEALSWSWETLLERSLDAAAWLSEQGVTPGSTVALTGEVCAQWVAFYHGVGWLGAAAVPIDPALSDERVDAIFEEMSIDVCCQPFDFSLTSSWSKNAAPAERSWPLDEVRLVVMTSGTTGRPAPVKLTTAQLTFSACGSAIRLGHLPTDRWLNCLPLHHVGGLSILIRTSLYGTTMRLKRSFVPTEIAAELVSGVITQVSLVPAMWEKVLDVWSGAEFPANLRTVLIGGASLKPDLRARGEALGAPVAETWGMTEAASQVCTRSPGSLGEGVGAPIPFARVENRDGRLVVDGPIVQSTHLSSDLGTVTDAGQVHITGRVDDVIISGGLNLQPTLIESVLLQHPGIKAAVVVGQKDAQWGQRPHALVVSTQRDERPSQDELISWCRLNLKNYEMPKVWHLVETLPLNELGKVSRKKIASSLDVWRSGQKTQAGQAVDKRLGTLDGSKVIECYESVLEFDGAAKIVDVVGTDDVVAESNGTSTESINTGSHPQAVGLADGSSKISFSVNQGRTKALLVKESSETAECGDEELLVTGVRVLEDAPKEDNTSPVNFVETRGDGDFECHERALLSQRTHKR